MKQHPVPQHISSYEFKLVGDMTLKQFFQLAGGAIMALIVYALPFPPYVKWPFMIAFGAFGAALAFLPIEERPLSTWVFAFLKAVYAPTIFVYNPKDAEDVFAKSSSEQIPASPVSEQYLSKPAKQGLLEDFETAEKNFFNRVTTLFQTTGGHSAPQMMQQSTNSPQINQPLPQQQINPMPIPEQRPQQPVQEQTQQIPLSTASILTMETEKTPVSQANSINKPPIRVQEEIDIPKQEAVNVGMPIIHDQVPQAAPHMPQQPQVPVQPVFPGNGNINQAKQATFTPEAAPPLPPSIPNTIVGQILASDGRIVDSAILEVRDAQNRPVRALRSNKVGHFLTVTPLANGDYQLEAEKDGFVFDPVNFKAEGKIIQPILIRAKG